MFLRDLELIASVGVHAHEKIKPQRIRVSIELNVGPRRPGRRPAGDRAVL